MRSLSAAFIMGIFVGSVVVSELSTISLSIFLIALLGTAIFLRSDRLRAIIFYISFFIAGVLRIGIGEDFLHLQGFAASFIPLRNQLAEGFAHYGITGDENAVVTAMSLGDKSGIGSSLKSVYSHAGASHVLALSGMHLAIIYVILSWGVMRAMLWLHAVPDLLWEKLPVERNEKLKKVIKTLLSLQPSEQALRNIASVVIMLMIWFYVILVGMSPSVVRSALMLTVYGLSRMLFRKTDTISVLAITAFVTLMLSPQSLFDVGFQMSYLAVLGIGVYMPRLMQLVFKEDVNWSEDAPTFTMKNALMWVYSSLALSFSAQIMVMPLVAYYFHSLPCYGLLSSLVVSVTAMLIVGISLFFLMALYLMPMIVCESVAYILNAVTHFQNVFLERITALPFATITDIDINVWQLVIVYVLIFFVSRILFILQRFSYPSSH